MKLSIRLLLCCLCLTVSSICWSNVYTGAVDEQAYLDLQNQVTQKQLELEAKMQQAESLGLSVDYAQVSLTTIKLFKNVFAPWDKQNPEAVKQAYDAKGFSRFDPVGPEGLAFDELSDSIVVAESALNQLQQQIDLHITLKAPPDFSQHDLVLNGPNYELNGQKVIAAKFFWQPEDSELMRAYGMGGETYYAVQDLETETSIRANRKNNFTSRINREMALGRTPIQFFLGHIVPQNSWLRTSYPLAFSSGTRLFTDYDIDNPNVKVWLNTLIENQLADGLSQIGETERIHMLANEPTFSIRENGINSDRGISDFTRQKYTDWLSQKYQNIASLNDVYGTSFNRFEQLADVYTIPLDLSYQGGPVWYDWMRFNMERVNNWFSFLHDKVHAVDTRAKTHIKVMGERAIHTSFYDEGLDFEFIANLADIPGSDNQATPLAAHWDVRFEQEWRERYSFEWRSQSIMLDFNKSLAPNKLFYDSEWHGLSGSRWRDFHMSPEYVRSILWTGAVDGLGGLTSWVWNRNEDGSIDSRADFIGTSVTQPIQLDAYGRTLKELNAHGNHVAALVPTVRPLLIYYSKDAAIQNPEHTGKMTDVYEALKLLNLSVGFVTPSTLSQVNKTEQTVIIPPTVYISDSDYVALNDFASTDGKLVVIGEEDNFTKNEMGAGREREALNAFKRLSFNNIITMYQEFKQSLQAVFPELPIQTEVTDLNDEEDFGVLSNQYYDLSSDAHIVSLINTRQNNKNINISSKSASVDSIVNLLDGREVNAQFTLKPMEVVLLQTKVSNLPIPVLLDGISLSISKADLEQGQKGQINTSLTPDNATDTQLTWRSSNESVATVSSTGEVTAVSAGNATIFAENQASNTSGMIEITVSIPTSPITPTPSPSSSDGSGGGSISTLMILLLLLRLTIRKRYV